MKSVTAALMFLTFFFYCNMFCISNTLNTEIPCFISTFKK